LGDAATALPMGVLGIVLVAAMAISAGLILALRPYFARYALARVNARSSHKEPTPQGGGIAVVTAALASIWLGAWLSGLTADRQLFVISVTSASAKLSWSPARTSLAKKAS